MSGKKSGRASARCNTAPLFADGDDAESGDARDLHVDAALAERIVFGPPAEPAPPARVLAGIDEAGLGPLLGPLTIGYSSFRVPHGQADLWRALRTVCTDEVEDDRERLVVADSKLVFTRDRRSERRLERTALAFLAQRDRERQGPRTARSMVDLMAREVGAPDDGQPTRDVSAFACDVASEPWSAHLARSLPVHGEHDELESVVAMLAGALSDANVELTGAGVRIVPVRELNASFAETQNKSITHWRATETLLVRSWRAHAHEGLDISVDRHGGRMYYAPLLAKTFARCSVHVLVETPPRSEYIVVEHADRSDVPAAAECGSATERGPAPRRMRITFAERAESTSFAVALASCLAKYARETCMHAFNAYFESLQPGLKPTAGYRNDGWRWLEDAGAAIERSGIGRSELVRER